MLIRRILLASAVLALTAGVASADDTYPYGTDYHPGGDSGIAGYAGLRGSIVEGTDTHVTASAVDMRAHYSTGIGGSLYAGTRLAYGFRIEGELLYRHFTVDSLGIAGVAQSNRGGYTQIAAPMANVFWDLPVPDFPLRPFIGAGVGGAFVDLHIRTGSTEVIGSNNWHFAYQLMAGAVIPLSTSSRLTGMYRYFRVQDANFHCTPPALATTTCDANTMNQSVDLGVEFDM